MHVHTIPVNERETLVYQVKAVGKLCIIHNSMIGGGKEKNGIADLPEIGMSQFQAPTDVQPFPGICTSTAYVPLLFDSCRRTKTTT